MAGTGNGAAWSRDAGKIVTAREAVRLIRDGDTVATGGFAGIGFAEEVCNELEAVFLEEDDGTLPKPKNLTIVFAAGQGDFATRGLNRLAHPGLVKRAIGGHFGAAPKLGKLAVAGEIEAYNLPQGVISHLFRDIASEKPGHLSRIGLGTFVDPRFGGGKVNSRTTENIVEVLKVGGKEYLFFKAFPINVAILRGTTADADGNVTLEREALTLDSLSMAMAAHNSGGLVIVQVERIAETGTLNPRQVKIPGALVDCIVVSRPELHMQTFGTPFKPAFASEIRVPLTSIKPMPMSERKIIARRAAMELQPKSVVNLGIGMPEGVAAVAGEEKISDLMTLTAEPGVIGGVPAGGLDFGAATNPQAIIDQGYQFDFYDGGGLDAAFLGLAQCDSRGNLNVSKFGPKLAGAGGFINISQNAKRVVFVGTFTAGDLEIAVEDGKLKILREGKARKFVKEVEQRTFSGEHAAANGKEVLYVTERCVFKLTRKGLELIEVAPGIDIKRDILGQMDFAPIVKKPVEMDPRIFAAEPMGLRDEMLKLPFNARFAYDKEQNILFLNFSELKINSQALIDKCVAKIESIIEPLKRRVHMIINYDGFQLDPELEDAYKAGVDDLSKRFYLSATRFTTSAFMRAKLGDLLESRGAAPHIHESEQEARAALKGK